MTDGALAADGSSYRRVEDRLIADEFYGLGLPVSLIAEDTALTPEAVRRVLRDLERRGRAERDTRRPPWWRWARHRPGHSGTARDRPDA